MKKLIYIVSFAFVLYLIYDYLKKKQTISVNNTNDGLSDNVQIIDSRLALLQNRIVDLENLSNNVLVQKNQIDSTFGLIQDRLDNLEYMPIAINTFTNSVNNVEKGSTINSITFNYTFNKVPTSISINNGIDIVDANSVTKAVNITNNTTFTLIASDGTNTVTANSSVNFLNKVYWGSKASNVLNNADILGLTNNALASAKARTITVDGNGQYIYYCYPASFGDANFVVGGLASSAWTKTVQDVTNALGNVTSYNVYRTNNVQNGTGINIQIN